MEIDLAKVPQEGVDRDDYLLFSESPSRLVVTVNPNNKASFEEILEGTAFAEVGLVQADNLVLCGTAGDARVDCPIADLKEAWQKTLRFLAGGA